MLRKQVKQSWQQDERTCKLKVRRTKEAVMWKCPACRHQLMYVNTKGEIHLSSRLSVCAIFEKKSQVNKGKLVEEAEGCMGCTSWMH